MIKITYCTRDRPDAHLSLVVDGHANYAEHGRDIVCASISVLFQTLAGALEEYAPQDNVSVRMSPGDSSITWNSRQSSQARTLTWAFVDGMQSVADAYPDYVQLTIE